MILAIFWTLQGLVPCAEPPEEPPFWPTWAQCSSGVCYARDIHEALQWQADNFCGRIEGLSAAVDFWRRMEHFWKLMQCIVAVQERYPGPDDDDEISYYVELAAPIIGWENFINGYWPYVPPDYPLVDD